MLVDYRGPGVLDGIALGPDGDVWVAIWGAGVVHRYDPTGRLREVATAPVRRPSAVAVVPVAATMQLVVTTARSQPVVGATAPSRPPAHDDARKALDPSPEGRLYATPLPS